jgi:hypothetical protein
MHKKSNKGFAANPELASRVAKETKARQSPEERTERSRAAVNARWKKEKQHGSEGQPPQV